MAKLEQYEQQVDLPRQGTPYQQVDADPRAFGVGLGRAMEGVGRETGWVYAKARTEAVEQAANDATLQFGLEAVKAWDEFKAKKGLDPAQSVGDYEAALGKLRQDIEAKLGDEEAAVKFRKATAIQFRSIVGHFYDHANGEVDKWAHGNLKGLQDLALKNAGVGISLDPAKDRNKLQADGETAIAETVRMGQAYGDSPLEIEASVRKLQGDMILAVAQGYVDEPGKLLQLLDKTISAPGVEPMSIREILGGAQAAKIEATARALNNTNLGLQLGKEAADLAYDPTKRAFNDKLGLAYIESATSNDPTDPNNIRIVEEAKKLYKSIAAERDAAQKAEVTNNYSSIFADFLANGHSLSRVRAISKQRNADVEWLRINAPEHYMALETAGLQWQERQRALAERKAPPTREQMAALAQFYADFANGVYDGAEGAKKFVANYPGNKLHEDDFKRELTMIGHQGAKSERLPAWYKTAASAMHTELIKAMDHTKDGAPYKQNGAPNEKWPDEHLDTYNAAMDDLKTFALADENKRRIVMREGKGGYGEVINNWASVGSAKRPWYNRDQKMTRGQAMRAGEEWTPDVSQIPRGFREQVVEEYRRNNATASEADVQAAWVARTRIAPITLPLSTPDLTAAPPAASTPDAAADTVVAERLAQSAQRKAEKARWDALPYWQQRAELAAQQEWVAAESKLRGDVTDRMYNEPGQRAARGKAIGATAEDAVHAELMRRVDAEVASGRAERRAAHEKTTKAEIEAYRDYYQKNMVNDDGSIKTFAPPGFIDDFNRWRKLRREGKVQP